MKKDDKTTPAEPVEVPAAAGLDDLHRQAQDLEENQAYADAQPSKAEIQQDQNLVDEILAALQMARGFAAPMCGFMAVEKFHETWNDKRLKEIAEPGAVVMKLNGWTLGQLLGKWAPYFALLGAALAPTLETLRAYKDSKAVQSAQPVEATSASAT